MKNNNWLKNSIVVCVLACICCALWGSAFPLVKIGYNMFGITSGATNSQILFAGTRFTLAGFMTIIIGSCLSKRILIPARRTWPKILNLSIYQTIIQYVLFYIGLSNTSGVKASIIEGVNVFVALLVASLIFRQEKITKRKMLGCIIGFIGVILINMNGSGLNTSFKLTGEGFIFLSTVSYAISTVILKQYSKEEDTTLLSGYQFVIGGLAMMVAGFFMGGKLGHFTVQSFSVLMYLALISAVAYTLWGILLKHNPISKVAVYGFMTPIFGVILSALLLKEGIEGFKSIIALILVSAGIYIVNYNREKISSRIAK